MNAELGLTLPFLVDALDGDPGTVSPPTLAALPWASQRRADPRPTWHSIVPLAVLEEPLPEIFPPAPAPRCALNALAPRFSEFLDMNRCSPAVFEFLAVVRCGCLPFLNSLLSCGAVVQRF